MDTKQKPGFTAMSQEKRCKIARLGSIVAHLSGKVHEGTVNLFVQTPAQEQARGDISDCFL